MLLKLRLIKNAVLGRPVAYKLQVKGGLIPDGKQGPARSRKHIPQVTRCPPGLAVNTSAVYLQNQIPEVTRLREGLEDWQGDTGGQTWPYL